MSRLLYVGQQVADDLKDKIGENLERYRSEDFLDMESGGDWRIPLSLDVDLTDLKSLNADGGSEAEIHNSLTVGHALGKLTPTLARENRLWVRLSHIECLKYSRDRWLPATLDDESAVASIAKHFFAPTLTGCRDDHSLSRLWWNHHIASQIIPEDPARALKMILTRADIRLNFLERPGIAARPALAKGIVIALENSTTLLNGEKPFRAFMRKVNLRGAGIAFELWTESKISEFMAQCLNQAAAESWN